MTLSLDKYRILGVEHAAIQKPGTGGPPPPMLEYDMHFINNVGFDVQQQDIAFEGDQQSVRKYFLNGVVVNVVCDTFDVAAISAAFNKQVVTAASLTAAGSTDTLPAGVAKRLYFGESAETTGVKCGFVAQIRCENITTQLMETLRFVAPVCALTVVRPPTLAYNSKAQLSVTFTAEKAVQDVRGVALAGVPADGCFWYMDALTGGG